jgi:hypothetical protein
MTRHILQKLNWSVALPRAFVTLIYGVSTFEFISGRFLESKLYMGGNLDAGDWLINYHGGFFKRGLFGQIFLGVFHLHGALANWDLFVFQCVLYFVILSYFISYVRKNNFSTSSIILTCNPAAIAFVGWNHGITRKELLGFVALVVLVKLRDSYRDETKYILSFFITLFPIAVLSHELNAAMIPAYMYLIWRIESQSNAYRYRKFLMIFTIGISFCGILVTLFSHPNKAIADKMCSFVIEHDFIPYVCTSSISSMGWPASLQLSKVFAHIQVHSVYLIFFALALLPIYLSSWWKQNWPFFLAVLVCVSPAFMIATDYGRWVSIIIMCLTLTIMSHSEEYKVHSFFNNRIVGLIYICSWGMPWYADFLKDIKWLGFFSTVFSWVA